MQMARRLRLAEPSGFELPPQGFGNVEADTRNLIKTEAELK